MFKKRKKDKEIDAMVKDVYSKTPQEEQVQFLKDSGLTADKTAAIVKVAAGNKKAGENVKFSTDDVDLVIKQGLTETKGAMQGLNEILHFTVDSFADALAEDSFELISILSLMSINKTDFQEYCINYYNYMFDFLNKPVNSSDIEDYLKNKGLGNVYVSNGAVFICSDEEWKRIDRIVDSTSKGLKALYQHFAIEGLNIDLMEISLKLYQTVVSLISSVCENYPGQLQTNFIVVLNNWLLSVCNFIPESLLSEEFVLNLKRVNTEMHRYDN